MRFPGLSTATSNQIADMIEIHSPPADLDQKLKDKPNKQKNQPLILHLPFLINQKKEITFDLPPGSREGGLPKRGKYQLNTHMVTISCKKSVYERTYK